MFIEEVRMSHFLSYDEMRLVFHQGINVVVGKNGSGKSNLIRALELVLLCPKFSAVERRFLMHSTNGDGEGPAPTRATVQVVLDNADGRFPLPDGKVVIERHLGPIKVDSFFLQGTAVSREHLLSLMRSAGFSPENPYFFVRQGQICDLASATDAKRLAIVAELAGARSFGGRKASAERMLRESEKELEEIDETLEEYESELKDLEEDVELLGKYKSLERKKRALEYVLLDYRRRELVAKIRHNENESNLVRAQLLPKRLELEREKLRLRDVKAEEAATEAEIKLAGDSRLALQMDIEKEVTKIAALEASFEEKLPLLKDAQKAERENARELSNLDVTIRKEEEKLHDLEINFSLAAKNLEDAELEKTRKDEILKNMIQRKGILAEFRSKEEKNDWITSRRAEMESKIIEKKRELAQVESFCEAKAAEIHDCKESVRKHEEVSEEYTSLQAKKSEVAAHASKLGLELNGLLREKSKLSRESGILRDKLIEANAKLKKNAGVRPLIVGFESLKKVLGANDDQEIKENVVGLVAELFEIKEDALEVKDAMGLALSVTLGRKLFYTVVKTAETAKKLLERMKQMELLGEVYFLSMDKLYTPRADNSKLPPRSRWLLDFINFDPDAEKAMRFLLDQKVLTENISDDTDVFLDRKLDRVTLSGEQAFSDGVVRGGFYLKQKALLNQYHVSRNAADQLNAVDEQIETIDKNIAYCSHQRNRALTEKETVLSKAFRCEQHLSDLVLRKQNLSKRLEVYGSELSHTREAAHKLRCDLQALEVDLNGLDELASSEGASQANSQVFLQLINDVKELNTAQKKAFHEKSRLEKLKREKELELYEGLMFRRRDVEKAVGETKVLRSQFAEVKSALDSERQWLSKLQSDRADLEKNLEELTKQKTEIVAELEEREQVGQKLKVEETELASKFERLEAKRKRLEAAREEAYLQVEGTLPQQEIAKYSKMTKSKQYKMLRQVEQRCDEMDGVVNVLALEQQQNLLEAKEKVRERRRKVVRDRNELLEMIDTVIQHRRTKVDFTYKQVSKYFSEIFKELAPGGSATMVFILDDEDNDSTSGSNVGSKRKRHSDDEDNPPEPKGISLRVRFRGCHEVSELRNLSGGQKSLAALTFILALQKCDPTPFFVFDEADAALDEASRHRLARYLVRQEQNKEQQQVGVPQLICTTFMPELLDMGERFFGVEFGANNVSHVKQLGGKDEARDLLDDRFSNLLYLTF